jgi:tetratricopeptide (TPR) repeat protein
MNRFLSLFLGMALSCSTMAQTHDLPDVPDGAQALSLTGAPLIAPEANPKHLDKLAVARADYDSDPDNADSIIWYGRRTAYTGDYRAAIRIFSEGVRKFPEDARMLRHRGHRYISIREFDRAITDLEAASKLIAGTENQIEPDGLPNAQNIPISSLHGNIWYHLGLAYYLKHDWDNAYRAYKAGFDSSRNDDNKVSTSHWLYMILRRMGKESEALEHLESISAEMKVIENTAYHNLCLFYKGEILIKQLMDDSVAGPSRAAVVYGLANWTLYNGDQAGAIELFNEIVASDGWSSFGYIAAEAELAVLGEKS